MLAKFLLATTERDLDYYYQKEDVGVASQVGE